MALKTPPPYFPQGIQEPNPQRYRKFKLIVALIIFVVLLLSAGLGIGIYYLVKMMFV